jgi:hypothetical protein
MAKLCFKSPDNISQKRFRTGFLRLGFALAERPGFLSLNHSEKVLISGDSAV